MKREKSQGQPKRIPDVAPLSTRHGALISLMRHFPPSHKRSGGPDAVNPIRPDAVGWHCGEFSKGSRAMPHDGHRGPCMHHPVAWIDLVRTRYLPRLRVVVGLYPQQGLRLRLRSIADPMSVTHFILLHFRSSGRRSVGA